MHLLRRLTAALVWLTALAGCIITPTTAALVLRWCGETDSLDDGLVPKHGHEHGQQQHEQQQQQHTQQQQQQHRQRQQWRRRGICIDQGGAAATGSIGVITALGTVGLWLRDRALKRKPYEIAKDIALNQVADLVSSRSRAYECIAKCVNNWVSLRLWTFFFF
jgi:hypothetical protein